MSETSPNLELPYLMPDQAQKHVTHNEALQRLDALTQIILADLLPAPPANPAEGACYAVIAPATGSWQGRAGQIACLIDGDWTFFSARPGWIAWSLAGRRPVWFDGSAWQPLPLPSPLVQDMLGAGATPDTTNRLAISSEASLFNHRGAGHQLKINRADEQATASLLYQTGFSGRAEFGLFGNANFGLKMSPDGTAWKNAIQIETNGLVRLPARPLCRTHLNAQTASPANGTVSGFQSFSVNQGGFQLAGDLAPGPGLKLVVPASGLYRLTLSLLALTSTGHGATVLLNGAVALLNLRGNGALASIGQSMSTMVALNGGDTLHIQHSGVAQVDFGPGKTELMAEFLP